LFERAAFRPEMLGAAADEIRFTFGLEQHEMFERFEQAVNKQIENADTQMLRVINALTPLQSSVLRVLASQRQAYSPFTSETMRAYALVLRAIAPDDPVVPDTSNVQQVLSALQDKLLVWKERRGVYALEDSALFDLLQRKGMLDTVPPA
jgi:hypothetical protein